MISQVETSDGEVPTIEKRYIERCVRTIKNVFMLFVVIRVKHC